MSGKTLGDTGLMPERVTYWHSKAAYPKNCVDAHNNAIDQISALPLKQIIEKALELGLIGIEMCKLCDNQGWDVGHHPECSLGRGECCDCGGEQIQCEPCSGNGFRITEGKG